MPNIIFEIVAGGALASLVVPLLAGAVAAGDRAAVAATTGALLTWMVTLLVPLAVLVAVLRRRRSSRSIGDGLTAAQQQVAAGARMLRVFAPQLPLYGIGIVLTGVLQAHRRFAWPVIAPLLSSVTVIGVYLVFTGAEGRPPRSAGVGAGGELLLSGGTTLGVVVLSLSLLIPLRRLGLRPRLGYRFAADARARVGGLAVAGVVTVAAQQIALLVILNRSPGRTAGTPSVYNLAQTVYLLPWAVLAVPLAVAAYPTLAAARAAGDEAGYRRTLAADGARRAAVQLPRRGRAGRDRRTGRPVLLRRAARRVDPTAAGDHRLRARPARLRPVRGALPGPLRPRRRPAAATVAITVGWLVVPAPPCSVRRCCCRAPTGCSRWRRPTRSACWCSARCCSPRCPRGAGRAASPAPAGPPPPGLAAASPAPPGRPRPCWPALPAAPRRQRGALAQGMLVRGRGRRRVPRRGVPAGPPRRAAVARRPSPAGWARRPAGAADGRAERATRRRRWPGESGWSVNAQEPAARLAADR